MLNFIAIDLQLYKIFKITRVSFGGGHIVYGKTVAEMVAAAVAGIVAVTAALIALCRSLYSTSSQTASLVLALIFI